MRVSMTMSTPEQFPFPAHKRVARFAAVILAAVLLGSCWLFNFSTPGIDLPVQAWYRESPILIPFSVWGDSYIADITYTFEAWDGSQWIERENERLEMPSGSSGVLEYDPGVYTQHRLTFTLLQTHDATGVPAEILTETRLFQIDTEPPDVDAINFWENAGQPAAVPYNDALELYVTVDGGELDTPSGAPVELVYTVDGPVPVEGQDPTIRTPGDQIWIWGAGETSERYLRVILVDDAGNRSDVRVIRYATF